MQDSEINNSDRTPKNNSDRTPRNNSDRSSSNVQKAKFNSAFENQKNL